MSDSHSTTHPTATHGVRECRASVVAIPDGYIFISGFNTDTQIFVSGFANPPTPPWFACAVCHQPVTAHLLAHLESAPRRRTPDEAAL